MRVRIRKHPTAVKWYIEVKKWYYISWEMVDWVTDFVPFDERKVTNVDEHLSESEVYVKALSVAQKYLHPEIVEVT